MKWTIIASIAAAISALFAALSAFLIWWQTRSRYKLKITKKFNDNNPQHIFNCEHNFAIVRVELQNKSAHTMFLSDCLIKLGDVEYWALQSNTDFSLAPNIILTTDYNAKIALNSDEHGDSFLKVPIELKPYEYLDKYLIFPNFIVKKCNTIKVKFEIHSLACRKKTKTIILYHQDCIDP